MNSFQEKKPAASSKDASTIRSLGTWMFDKRSRKRKYISLTGKVFTGQDAIRQSRADQYSESHPAQQCRMELCLLHAMTSIEDYILAFLERQNKISGTSNRSCVSSSLCGETLHYLSSWGIPEPVLRRYRSAKIVELFPWQIECILSAEGRVLSGEQNLVYTAPTSGGKTLVAELLMLRKLASTMTVGDPKLHRRRTIFFVVPFIALADEKLSYFQYMWQDMNIGVRGYHQEDGTATNELGEDVEVVVCTIERANILFTHLLEMHREDQLSMVVIDEIHLLSDKQRGFLLEVLLSKVKYILGNRVQIIGMSATLPNIQDLATWLDARLYMTSFRPVALKTLVCESRVLYEAIIQPPPPPPPPPPSSVAVLDSSLDDEAIMAVMDAFESNAQQQESCHMSTSTSHPPPAPTVPMNVEDSALSTNVTLRELRPLPPVTRDDDGLLRLCLDTVVMEEKSALLFCNSKHRCEVVAKKVAEAIRGYYHQQHMQQHREQAASMNMAVTFRPLSSSAAAAAATTTTAAAVATTSSTTASHAVMVPGILSSSHATVSAISSSSTTAATLFQTSSQRIHQQRQQLLDQLRQLSVGLCPILRDTIPYGVAYHHAGLTQDERILLEQAFRSQDTIKLLVTTSTLSAGVNLPAHRVILRGLTMGDKYLSVATFKQMCGRAGRTGLDVTGEAIVMLETPITTNNAASSNSAGSSIPSQRTREQRQQLMRLLTQPLDPLLSHLQEGYGGGIEKILLEMVVCQRIQHEVAVVPFMMATLFAAQYPYESVVYPAIKQALLFLRREQFVQNMSDGSLLASPLGKATTLAGLSPQDAVLALPSLIAAKHRLILAGSHTLHLIYLITPISISPVSMTSTLEPTWIYYEDLLDTLFRECPESETVASYLGITRAQAQSFRFSSRPIYQTNSSSIATVTAATGVVEDTYVRYKRFYNAILLFLLMEEWPLTKVLAIYERESTIGRGKIQQLQKDASVFGMMLTTFCQALNWPILAAALQECHKKLCYGTQRSELIPLMRLGIEIMPATRAKLLWQQDVHSIEELVSVPVETLATWLIASLPYQERDILDLVGSAATTTTTNTTSTSTSTSTTSSGGGEGVNSGGHHERGRQLLFTRALRLAQSILSRAEKHIREDMQHQQQQQHYMANMQHMTHFVK